MVWEPAQVEAPTDAGASPLLDAATVILLREVTGLECLMLRKNAEQAYGGLWVFPGGRVEPGDGEGLAGARGAAVRETREEAGLVLDRDALVPFSHWTPPLVAPRRYATWFFLAALPDGASDVVIDGGEIGDQMWVAPGSALTRHQAGEIDLAIPTWMTLRRLAANDSVASALADAHAREAERFATRIVTDDGTVVALWAPDAGYESGDLAEPGRRHRLYLDPSGWRYENDGTGG